MRRFSILTFALLAVLAAPFALAQDADDPVVVRLGEQTETLSEFEQRFEIALRSLAAQQGTPLNDQLRAQLASFAPQYLEQRGQEFALLAAADARGIEPDMEAVQARIDQAKNGLPDEASFDQLLQDSGIGSEAMLRTLFEEDERIRGLFEAVEAEQSLEEGAVRAAYEARQDEFTTGAQVCARHILVETVEDAESVLAELDGGADFADLAAERSTGPSGPDGGDLGCFERGMMVAPFEEAAFAADAGEVVGPVETQFGQHVILVEEVREGGVQAFEDVEEALRGQLLSEATQADVDALVEAADVETFPDRLPSPTDGAAPAPMGDDADD
jgi:peptidyl-prolyl cis-trans isomerase C